MARWQLVKFIPDVRRKEPVNIGVIVDADGAWAARFSGQDAQGRVDGRKLRGIGLDRDVLESWIDYYERKLAAGRWEDVERMQARKTHTIYVDPGGFQFEDEPVDVLAERLFRELVGSQPPEAPASPAVRLRSTVNKIFDELNIAPEIDPNFEVDWGGEHPSRVHFDYGYTNGHYHLIDRLSLSSAADLVARDYWARAEAARSTGRGESFVAFYSSSAIGDAGDLDDALRPIEAQGAAIDTDDFYGAVETTAQIFNV